jgi:hypothetical protein
MDFETYFRERGLEEYRSKLRELQPRWRRGDILRIAVALLSIAVIVGSALAMVANHINN